jgi:4-amino-4-deoxy-L-arabinose transferase-like glycosyltransferase
MNPLPTRNFVYLVGSALILCIASWFFLWNLGASSISLRSDEVIYTRIVQGILHKENLFPLYHGNVPTFEKPPCKLWLSALAPYVFGESNASFRILDGLLGIVVVWLTISIAFALTHSASMALLSGALILGMPELVISHHGFRRAVLDGLLTTLTLVSALVSWRIIATQGARSSYAKQYLLLGVVCSLAVLTKSVAGFVPAVCAMVAIAVCVPASERVWRAPAWWSIALLPVTTFLAYAALLGVVGGLKALKVFLGVEIFSRAFSGFEGHNTGEVGWYLWYLFVRGASAPRLLLIAGICGALLSLRKDTRSRYLCVWALLPVLLYSCAASRVPWYLNPSLPFLAMLAVYGAYQLANWASTRLTWRPLREKQTALRAILITLFLLASSPPYIRAVSRHARFVSHDTERLAVDILFTTLKEQHSSFVIIDNALSGRSQPHRGRFNVEGIYREMLKPHLRTVRSIDHFTPVADEVALVKDSALARLPQGWREVGRAEPFGERSWTLVAIQYAGGAPTPN